MTSSGSTLTERTQQQPSYASQAYDPSTAIAPERSSDSQRACTRSPLHHCRVQSMSFSIGGRPLHAALPHPGRSQSLCVILRDTVLTDGRVLANLVFVYELQLEGEWRGKSRGGNPLLSTWIYNPQWHFTVASHGSPLSCLITLSSESDVAVNVILVRLDDRSASRHRLQKYVCVLLCEQTVPAVCNVKRKSVLSAPVQFRGFNGRCRCKSRRILPWTSCPAGVGSEWCVGSRCSSLASNL